MPTIGQSIVFKGELSGEEDLEIDGQIEGTVRFENSQLTVGPNGHVQAEIHAKSIVVVGRVTGNLKASERIEIQASGIVHGDLDAPSLQIHEGAKLDGRITMSGASSSAQAGSPNGSSASAGGVQQSA